MVARHREEILLGILDRLLDRHWHLVRLAVANADLLDLVPDHDQRGEGEAAATLDDLSDAIDLDDALVELSPVCIRTDATCHQNSRPPSRAPSASALTRP